MSAVEYRLSWEMPNPHDVDRYEREDGKDVWTRTRWTDDWFASWKTVTKITTDPWDQHETLKAWAESREQPIRNVVLEQREVPNPAEGWRVVARDLPVADRGG